MTKTPKEDPKRQIHEFKKAARELGADEFDERFREALRIVAKHKPKNEMTKKRGS